MSGTTPAGGRGGRPPAGGAEDDRINGGRGVSATDDYGTLHENPQDGAGKDVNTNINDIKDEVDEDDAILEKKLQEAADKIKGVEVDDVDGGGLLRADNKDTKSLKPDEVAPGIPSGQAHPQYQMSDSSSDIPEIKNLGYNKQERFTWQSIGIMCAVVCAACAPCVCIVVGVSQFCSEKTEGGYCKPNTVGGICIFMGLLMLCAYCVTYCRVTGRDRQLLRDMHGHTQDDADEIDDAPPDDEVL